MKIHVLPGPIKGSELALTNHLHQIRYQRGATALIDRGDDAQTTRVARNWAERANVPLKHSGIPDLLVVTADFEAIFAEAEGAFSPILTKMRNSAWQMALDGLQPRPNLLQRLRLLFHDKKTEWVNTTATAYTDPHGTRP